MGSSARNEREINNMTSRKGERPGSLDPKTRAEMLHCHSIVKTMTAALQKYDANVAELKARQEVAERQIKADDEEYQARLTALPDDDEDEFWASLNRRGRLACRPPRADPGPHQEPRPLRVDRQGRQPQRQHHDAAGVWERRRRRVRHPGAAESRRRRQRQRF